MTATAIGHNENAVVKSFIEKRRAIWAARVPVQVKVIALAILEHMTPHNLECYPGKQRLAYMCNMPQNTFDRHYPAAKALFHYHDSRGKPTVFSPKILDVASEIAKLWPSKDDPSIPKSLRYKVPPKMGGTKNGDTPKMGNPQNAKSTPQNGVVSTPHFGGPKRSEKRSLEETIPNAHARGRGAIADPFGLNPHMQGLREDVWVDADDRLQVGNGFKVELEGLAGGPEQLRIELDMAAEWVGLNHPPQVLKAKVRGRVLKQITERKDRDRRYEKAKQQNDSTRQRYSGSVPIKLDDSDRPKTKPRPREEVEV